MPPVNSHGQFLASDPATSSLLPLTYHGGVVMGSGVTVHTIFWAPPGYAFQGSPGAGAPTYEQLIQQYFTDVANDSGASGACTPSECNVFTVLRQYGQGITPGAVKPGSYSIQYSAATDTVIDPNPYPAASAQCASPGGAGTCITDAQLQAEIDRVVQSTPGSPRGLTNLWFVFLPPNVDECITPGNCGTSAFAGYHSLSNLNGHGVTIYALAIDPIIETQVGSGSDPQGYPDAEVALNIAAHETIEAMTDPEGTGWMDPNGGEGGDKCVATGQQVGTPLGFANGSPYNQVIGGHQYLIQEMWANLSTAGNRACVQSTLNDTVQLPLPQVNLRQFSPLVTGNVNRASGGGIHVQVALVRSDEFGTPVTVAKASTTTAPDGSWSVSLAPHAPGDDRDQIEIDYSGAGAPQPSHQVILTGNGGNPFTEAGWTGWFDLANGTAPANSPGGASLTVAPCFQAGLLGFSFNGTPSGPWVTDFCNTQTNSTRVPIPHAGPADALTVTSNDNRAFDSPNGPVANDLGGLVSLTVPVGEAGAVSPFTHPLAEFFTPGGTPRCTADLEFQAVLCTGLVPNQRYQLSDGRERASLAADPNGIVVSALRVHGGDTIALSNGARTLSTLHAAHLRVGILGEQAVVATGRCQAGEYYGAPPSSYPTTLLAGLPTNDVTHGVALTGQVCPLNGGAGALPADNIAQTDELSGGQTETEVPSIQDTSPTEGEILYGKFRALAESGLTAPGNFNVPTDRSTRIGLRILTATRGRTVFKARNVDTVRGVAVPALKTGAYLAVWLLSDANGDARLMATRFIEESGRLRAAHRARVQGDQIRSLHLHLHLGGSGTWQVTLMLAQPRGGSLRVSFPLR